MLARTLVIAAMLGLAYYLYRRWQDAKKIAASNHPPEPQAMRKCTHCGVHLPEKEAVSLNQLYFCSEDHKHRYLQEHP